MAWWRVGRATASSATTRVAPLAWGGLVPTWLVPRGSVLLLWTTSGRERSATRAGEKAWTARCRSAVSPLTLSPAPLPARRLSSVHQFSTRKFHSSTLVEDVSVFLLLLALDSSGSLQFRMSVSLSTGQPNNQALASSVSLSA
jgi:hypothetical protein